MSIKEEYLIIDGLKPPISIHVARWCVVDFTVQWDIVMDILGLLLGLVNNDGRHESFPISWVKDK